MDEVLEAKGLLLGHRNDIVKNFISDKFDEIHLSDKLLNPYINRSTNYWVYENISNILFELYQKTGIDLYYDEVSFDNDYLEFVVKYVDDNERVKIEINWG